MLSKIFSLMAAAEVSSVNSVKALQLFHCVGSSGRVVLEVADNCIEGND